MVSIHHWKRLLSCWDGFHHGTSDFSQMVNLGTTRTLNQQPYPPINRGLILRENERTAEQVLLNLQDWSGTSLLVSYGWMMLYNEWIMISHGGSWYSFKTCQNRLTKKSQALSSKPSPMLWCLNSFRNAGGAAQNQLFQDTCETTSKGRGLVLSLEVRMARSNPWDAINCLNWWDCWRVWWYCSIKTRVQKSSCSFFHLLPDDWTDYLWPFFAHIHIYIFLSASKIKPVR